MRCARSAICRGRSPERLSLGALALGAALTLTGCDPTAAIKQPIDFSHKRHIEADIECLTCHEKAADEPQATLPVLKGCAKCHKEPQGKTVEEAEFLEYVKRKEEVPWIQVNTLPGHVYFSHRAHVGFAEMECNVCHGDMKSVEHSLTRSNTSHLTMRACIACHAQKSVSNDCVTCHQ